MLSETRELRICASVIVQNERHYNEEKNNSFVIFLHNSNHLSVEWLIDVIVMHKLLLHTQLKIHTVHCFKYIINDHFIRIITDCTKATI